MFRKHEKAAGAEFMMDFSTNRLEIFQELSATEKSLCLTNIFLVEKISESLMAENIINTTPRQLFSSKTGLGASYMVSHSERTSYQISSSFRLGGCLTNKQLQLNNSVETRIICQEQNRQCRPNFTIWTKFRNIFTRIIIIVAIS